MDSLYARVNRMFVDTCVEFGIAYAQNEETADPGDLFLEGEETFCVKEKTESGSREISAWQFTDDMVEALEMARVFNMRRQP